MVIKAVPVEVKVKKVLYFSDLLLAVWQVCQTGKKQICQILNRADTITEKAAVENWYYVPTKLNPASGKAKLRQIK